MRILITGGSGFIGTNLIEFYLSKGIQVSNIDIKMPRNKNQKSYWDRIDVRDMQKLRQSVFNFKPDYVIHLAAKADLTGKTLQDYSSNIQGVKNIMTVCNEVVSIKKVVFISTQLVCKCGYYPKDYQDYCPPNLYGESKVIGEKLIQEASSSLRYKWVIIRPTSIWGPWFGPTYRGFFQLILKKRYFNFSGKMALKTYGYVGNTVYQINALLNEENTHGRVFYVGDYEPTDIKEWATEIANEINFSVRSLPRLLIWCSAKMGDFLGFFNVRFPMNTYRYVNMTTDNIIPLEETKQYAPDTAYNRIEGNRLTIQWMNDFYRCNHSIVQAGASFS
ncbi:MAG: NAD(P)-dependent oxidoreductase [Clostridiaceae bacterium]|nr:NAD(P)-dependent oxidoreductase [Clostridiaceae bacterium]